MEIQTIPYHQYKLQVPNSGHHILGQQTSHNILVYQAFNRQIAEYATKNQLFGGNHYSFSRMTWIKPNFLWMMYRCGWAEKINQERVLAIWIKKTGFSKILEESVYSSYKPDIYKSEEIWKSELESKNVRLQWDPDHDIYGNKEERRAIQLGLKNETVREFNSEMIQEIIDVTEFVRECKMQIDEGNIEELKVPIETIYHTDDELLNEKLGII